MRIGVLTDETSLYADSGGAGSVLAAQMAVGGFRRQRAGRPDRDRAWRHAEQARCRRRHRAALVRRAGRRCDHRPAGHADRARGADARQGEEAHGDDHRLGDRGIHLEILLAGQHALGRRHPCAHHRHGEGGGAARRQELVFHHRQHAVRLGPAGRRQRGRSRRMAARSPAARNSRSARPISPRSCCRRNPRARR